MNSGGVRYDVYKGPFSTDNMYQLSPFEDAFYCIENVPREIVLKILPILNKDGELMRKRGDNSQDRKQSCFGRDVLTPGYVTSDDFGTDGN